MEKQYSYLLTIVTDHKPTEDEMMEVVEKINYAVDNVSLSISFIGEISEDEHIEGHSCGCDSCYNNQHKEGDTCND